MARAWSDIADFLDGLAPANLTLGVDLFKGAPQPPGAGVPALCVFSFAAGIGEPPQTFHGSGSDVRRHSVQLIIRGNRQASQPTADLADKVWSSLNHAKPLVAGGPAQYITVNMDQSSAIRLENDDEDRPRFSINLTAVILEQNP